MDTVNGIKNVRDFEFSKYSSLKTADVFKVETKNRGFQNNGTHLEFTKGTESQGKLSDF